MLPGWLARAVVGKHHRSSHNAGKNWIGTHTRSSAWCSSDLRQSHSVRRLYYLIYAILVFGRNICVTSSTKRFRLHKWPTTGIKNYGLALIPTCHFGYFTLASLIVNVPFSIVWCLAGSKATSLAHALTMARQGGGKAITRILVVGLVLVSAFWLVSRKKRRRSGSDPPSQE